jgi:hypothetical protein
MKAKIQLEIDIPEEYAKDASETDLLYLVYDHFLSIPSERHWMQRLSALTSDYLSSEQRNKLDTFYHKWSIVTKPENINAKIEFIE